MEYILFIYSDTLCLQNPGRNTYHFCESVKYHKCNDRRLLGTTVSE